MIAEYVTFKEWIRYFEILHLVVKTNIIITELNIIKYLRMQNQYIHRANEVYALVNVLMHNQNHYLAQELYQTLIYLQSFYMIINI